MPDTEALMCCGIKELHSITGKAPETILSTICQDYFEDTPRAFMIFSVTKGSPSGHNLAHYIEKHGLGKVTKMPSKMNPNTHHIIHVWMWAVNNPAFKSLGIRKGWYEW